MYSEDGVTNSTVVNNSISTDPTRLYYDSGGTHEVIATDTITGASSGATCTVDSVTLESGTWAGGDAKGYFTISSLSGIFENNEQLDEGANTNVATSHVGLGIAIVMQNSCDGNILKGNTVWGSVSRPYTIVGDAYGERTQSYFGTVAAETNDEKPVLISPGPNGIYLLNVQIVAAATITADASNYTTFTLKRRGDNDDIDEFNTNTAGDNVTLTAWAPYAFPSLDVNFAEVVADDIVTLEKVDSGNGQATDEMIVVVDFATY